MGKDHRSVYSFAPSPWSSGALITRALPTVTSIVLVICSLLVTSKQYFGEPIQCIRDKRVVPSEEAINTYCWVHSTFIISKYQTGIIGKEVPHPGVGLHVEGEDEVIYHKYYQWVCFMLFFQAVLFSLPHHLWKIWEGRRLRLLAVDLGDPVVGESWGKERKRMLLSYLRQARGTTHGFYATRFTLCEFLNLVNVVGQVYLLDLFLGGIFTMYGPSIAFSGGGYNATEMSRRLEPMDRYFPKVTKCIFHYFGPSGTIQNLDVLCVLPLNVVNEKIFFVLWFWYVALTVMSTAALLYRLMVMGIRPLRIYLLMAQVRFIERQTVRSLVNHIGYGDWFFLRQLGKNLNPVIFQELLVDLEEELAEVKPRAL